MSEKQHISKGERKRRNRAEWYSQLEKFRLTLLQRTDKQIASIISDWMDSVEINNEFGNYSDSWDTLCKLLGFRVVPCVIDPQSYESYSAWKAAEGDDDEEYYGVEFKLDDLTDFRQQIKALSLKDLDMLTNVAFQALTIKAEDEAEPRPPYSLNFIPYLIGNLPFGKEGEEESEDQ